MILFILKLTRSQSSFGKNITFKFIIFSLLFVDNIASRMEDGQEEVTMVSDKFNLSNPYPVC